MLKKLVVLLFIVSPIALIAQDKIGYVNSEEIFMQMPELRDVESKMATKQQEIQKNLAAMEAEYNKKVEEFQNDSTEVTESIIVDRQTQLQQIQERFQTYYENSNREVTELRQQLVSPLQQKFQKAVQEVGAENGFTYILEGQVLLYTGSSATNVDSLVKSKLGIN